jgi:hypothetical protein
MAATIQKTLHGKASARALIAARTSFSSGSAEKEVRALCALAMNIGSKPSAIDNKG